MLVLDDLMDQGGRDKRVLDLFTKHSHHRNITILYLCQDLFPPGPYAKTVSRNAHYIVCFKNPRDRTGLTSFGVSGVSDRGQMFYADISSCHGTPLWSFNV